MATEATLASIDAAVESRCAGPGCGQILTERSASAYWCSSDCQEAWNRQRAHRPEQVRGSTEVAPGPARWRPELESNLDAFDATGLELVRIEEVRGLTRQWYRRTGSDNWWFRLDDGYRFVGVDVTAEIVGEWEASDQVWSRMERELTDPRRFEPAPCPQCVNRCEPGCGCTCWGISADEAAAAIGAIGQRIWDAAEAQEGEQAVLSGGTDPRAEGTVFWMPEPPADPEAPTLAELAGGIDITPYVVPDEGPADGVYESTDGRHRMIVGTGETVRFGSTTDAIRRVGEQLVAAGAGAVAAYSLLPEATRRAIAAAVQDESDQVALRAACNDEAMYERALAAAQERGMSVWQMFEAVAVGRYIDSGWAEWSCGIDVDPTGEFPPPNYDRLDHVLYQLWCSLSDEAKVAALRAARDVAAVSRCRQEQALATILATRGVG